MNSTDQMLSELNRAKVLFQARAIATAMGLPQQPVSPAEPAPLIADLCGPMGRGR